MREFTNLSLENKINTALDYLVEKSFTNLKRETILIEIRKGDSYFMYTIINKIFVSSDCSELNNKALIGVLAHELVHLSDYHENPVKDFFRKLLYNFPYFRTKLERRIDLEVIHRGFGEYLLEFLKYHDRYYKKYSKTDGLTTEEVKKILQAINA